MYRSMLTSAGAALALIATVAAAPVPSAAKAWRRVMVGV